MMLASPPAVHTPAIPGPRRPSRTRTLIRALEDAGGAYLEPLIAACRAEGWTRTQAARAIGQLVRRRRACLVPTHTMGIGVLPVSAQYRGRGAGR